MMIQQMEKKMKMLCSITVILFLFMASASTVSAKTDVQGHQTLKVAFPQVKGLTETDQNGKRHGLVVDYLNEIAKYTGWEYQYIDIPVDELMEEFSEGKFDLMGGTYYIPGLEEEYAYPDYNMGYSKAVLLGDKRDNSIRRYDLNSIQGKTIGVYERATENIRRLQEFLDMEKLICCWAMDLRVMMIYVRLSHLIHSHIIL
ncbi:substrate-binding periplasmic protein [Blautia marasmi]|uniref:substrate-binding periplasmic protein n=1 Tax=Blautia marasmi TaxID=1917868 RepID=UPI000CF22974|nr:transporter substrate-binding domain-containing protein [Blautia marasmi]